MVVSMTGFGRSNKNEGSFSALVEIKTVNHRFAEYQIRMPRQFLYLEDKIKKQLNAYIQRGRTEVFITIEGQGILSRNVHIDWALLDEYYQYIRKIKDRYAIDKEITIQDLTREELINIEEKEANSETLEKIVLSAVGEACIQLRQMRTMEGAVLEKDLSHQLNQLKEHVILLKDYAPNVVQQYQEKLAKRMNDLVSGQFDEGRILTEVAIFADKVDINEELTRLNSHIKQFTQTLLASEPIGRKLDFILQEMNRETNTIGSKANDYKIASEVVEMKSLLEKMKEQVQNVE
ncbi:YicC/YloC family endoribonuclease [Cytobacillus dafuensis]|uniref:YicC family protein n=1 Tax=Cytobacillus dafuensis TaxID=1742359 RepID=A0A5B8Z5N6_CYTDA|nr:YicC/YloC family endoribonuclease [Cytobacillus dafuensis]QED47483.1 YicC family protein [Cytobacillus dafuensis]